MQNRFKTTYDILIIHAMRNIIIYIVAGRGYLSRSVKVRLIPHFYGTQANGGNVAKKTYQQ